MDESERSRLRWRCRRGMRELDVLFERWLDRRWLDADASERSAFERLLEIEDDRLWDWVSGRSRPDDPELARILEQVAPAARD